MVKNLSIFIFSFLFNSILFRRLLNRDSDVAISNFGNIKSDLERVDFPIYFEIDSYLIVSFISVLTTLFIYYFVQNKFSTENPMNVLIDIFKLFLLYAGTLLGVFYLLRQYDLSRGILIIFMILFPVLMYILLLLINLGDFKKISNVMFIRGSFVYSNYFNFAIFISN